MLGGNTGFACVALTATLSCCEPVLLSCSSSHCESQSWPSRSRCRASVQPNQLRATLSFSWQTCCSGADLRQRRRSRFSASRRSHPNAIFCLGLRLWRTGARAESCTESPTGPRATPQIEITTFDHSPLLFRGRGAPGRGQSLAQRGPMDRARRQRQHARSGQRPLTPRVPTLRPGGPRAMPKPVLNMLDSLV